MKLLVILVPFETAGDVTVHVYGYHVLCMPHSRLHAMQYTVSQWAQCANVWAQTVCGCMLDIPFMLVAAKWLESHLHPACIDEQRP